MAFHVLDRVGTPNTSISRLNSPAYTCPYRRFATPSRVVDARLGVTVDRYSFGVELFHLLLHAGLSRRFPKIPDGGVLPETSATFPPPGEAPDKLRLTRQAFTDYVSGVTDVDGAAGERWLSSLVTDLSVDKDSRVDISLYTAPSGKQSMRTMLDKPLALIRNNPALLREALVAWRRYPGVTGEYLDHRVLFDAVDAPDGKPAERGVPGATWLALMSYPLLRTVALNGQPMSTCWQNLGRRTGRRMIYPLWTAALDVAAVGALVSHPVLASAEPGPPPQLAALLSVFWVGHASRRRIAGRNFSGVLAPTTSPVRPAAARRPPW